MIDIEEIITSEAYQNKFIYIATSINANFMPSGHKD